MHQSFTDAMFVFAVFRLHYIDNAVLQQLATWWPDDCPCMSGPSSTTAVRNTQGMKNANFDRYFGNLQTYNRNSRMSEVRHLNMHEARVALF